MSDLRTDAPIQELCDHFGDWFRDGVKNEAGNAARIDVYKRQVVSAVLVGMIVKFYRKVLPIPAMG